MVALMLSIFDWGEDIMLPAFVLFAEAHCVTDAAAVAPIVLGLGLFSNLLSWYDCSLPYVLPVAWG